MWRLTRKSGSCSRAMAVPPVRRRSWGSTCAGCTCTSTDGTQQRGRRNAGPLYPSSAGWVDVHVIVDARIVTVIACNRTAITATVSPSNASFDAMSVVVGGGGGGAAREVEARAWLLDTAN